MSNHAALYTTAEIRDVERAAIVDLPPGTLMQRAGQAAANLALALAGMVDGSAGILVFAGPGNNGGDALEAAYRLSTAGLPVTVMLYGDETRYSADAMQALLRARQSTAEFPDTACLHELISRKWSLAIDGLFGIGLARPIAGAMRDAVLSMRVLNCPVVALDVPSGLSADTGNVVGGNGVAVAATHTITYIGNKCGLHTGSGRDYAGLVQVAALDIPDRYFPTPSAWLTDVGLFAAALRRRLHASHKGSYGDLAVVGGARGMAGAVILASRAAVKCGAGRVFAVFLESAPAYDSMQPELMCRSASEFDIDSGVLVAGPGMGSSEIARDVLTRILETMRPLVLDADALNIIATEPALQRKLEGRRGPTIMTPHPLEAARLSATTTAAVQADRLAAARTLAVRFNAIVILKGSGSVIARPDQTAVINVTGNPALATAGTGDVLAGVCGALLAQGWAAWEAALAGPWLHGHAADVAVSEGIGPVGLTAGELIPYIRSALNQLIGMHVPRHINSSVRP
ncbi:MAG: hypothetical protein JWR25_32 [Noviherbaspirillum sp.]|nr:hypothetical protein [Noviherbaspirillum sp.]